MLELLLLPIGVFLLVKGADLLIDGGSDLARALGISPLAIGLTIVAFGTSFPELIVNIFSSIIGASQISLGNIIGSNIANILLILGIAATLANVKIRESVVYREIPYGFLAAFILFSILAFDLIGGRQAMLKRSHGVIFISFFIIFIYLMLKRIEEDRKLLVREKAVNLRKAIIWISVGIIGTYFGGKFTVDGAISLANTLNLSQFLISSTLIAVGTSLPELATTISAARKRKIDLLVGNLVGSNVFNIFWVLGLSALIRPIAMPAFVLFDSFYLVMTSYILLLFVWKRKSLNRFNGFLLLSFYIIYLIVIASRG